MKFEFLRWSKEHMSREISVSNLKWAMSRVIVQSGAFELRWLGGD
jgi:hypothetical protein